VIRGLDREGREYLDSAITIRTMEVDLDGQAVIQTGASIVRDSVPAKLVSRLARRSRLEQPHVAEAIQGRLLDREVGR
jgi:hypothetical protein